MTSSNYEYVIHNTHTRKDSSTRTVTAKSQAHCSIQIIPEPVNLKQLARVPLYVNKRFGFIISGQLGFMSRALLLGVTVAQSHYGPTTQTHRSGSKQVTAD